MKVGSIDVHIVSDGQVRLDGGGLFGVVPRPLWRNLAVADRMNRVAMGLNCLLVRTGGKNVLVDTGVGAKHPPRRRALFAMTAGRLLRRLKEHGLEASDIDLVVLTHLHFDHAGGCTKLVRGKLVPTFPKARYIVQQRDWTEATYTNDRTKPAYLTDDFLPLQEHGVLELVDGEADIAPGVRVHRTGGHTAGHQMVLMHSEGERLACLGDVFPTHHHLRPHWVTAWDGYPLDTVAAKRDLLAQAEREGWRLLFGHGTQQRAGRLVRRDGQLSLEPIEVD